MSPAEASEAETRARRRPALAVLLLCAVPAVILLLSLIGPFRTDALYHHSGIVFDAKPQLMNGEPSIEPNIGITSQALGTRAALDIAVGRWPLWNHFEGLGAPLLGEMQSAALFPPTLLMLLPHGQGIEHLLLEALGGFGTFLFFRKFGLGRRAAVFGAVAFEVNGVYSWLRNAIFNPVAFLPWLFFALECMIANAAGGLALRRRLPMIGLGAFVAALSLYAGSPEEVYLYGLMLVAWTLLRATALAFRAVVRLAADLALTGIVALLLSAPLLVAFSAYLPEAELAQHGNGGFAHESLGRETLLQYIAPYVYGRIFAISRPAIEGSWERTGGYIGFTPLVLAAASFFLPTRRATKLFLLGWIAVAVGTSHGVPGIQQAFNAIPMVADATSYRYLTPSWIFALIFLSALFIDGAPTLTAARLRRAMAVAVAVGSGLTLLAVAGAWSLLSDLLSASAHEGRTVTFALLAVVVIAVALLATNLERRPTRVATLVGGIMVLEALAWFAYPSLSYPRGGVLDRGLVAFLRSRIGFQRSVNTLSAGLGNNYGSYFGISTIDFDDLPVPKRTNAYVTSHLDPFAGGTSFMPEEVGLSLDERNEAQWLARLRLPAYAEAGVKFVLSAPGYLDVWPYNVSDERPADAYGMPPGSEIDVRLTQDSRAKPLLVTGVTAALTAPAAGGGWGARVCADQSCADGRVFSSAQTDEPVAVQLDQPVVLGPGNELTIRLRRQDGGPASLRMVRLPGEEGRPAVSGSAGPVANRTAPDIRLRDGGVTPVYQGRSMSVYELANVRPYLSAEDCTVTAPSRDSADLDCRRPSSLLRLETAMAGWSATVNGERAAMGVAEDTFQTVAVPVGRSHVELSFAPRGFRAAVAAAGLATVILLGIAAMFVMDRQRRREHAR